MVGILAFSFKFWGAWETAYFVGGELLVSGSVDSIDRGCLFIKLPGSDPRSFTPIGWPATGLKNHSEFLAAETLESRRNLFGFGISFSLAAFWGSEVKRKDLQFIPVPSKTCQYLGHLKDLYQLIILQVEYWMLGYLSVERIPPFVSLSHIEQKELS